MYGFRQKRTWRSIFHSKITLVVLLLLCVPLTLSVYERSVVQQEMAERRLAVEEQRAALLSRKKALEERVRYLSDERGVEAQMRRQFDVAKEGEQVIILLDGEEEATNTRAIAAPAPKPESPWYLFWR